MDRVGDWGAGYSNLGVWGLEAQTVLVYPIVLCWSWGSQPDYVGQEDLLSLQSYGSQYRGREANENHGSCVPSVSRHFKQDSRLQLVVSILQVSALAGTTA